MDSGSVGADIRCACRRHRSGLDRGYRAVAAASRGVVRRSGVEQHAHATQDFAQGVGLGEPGLMGGRQSGEGRGNIEVADEKDAQIGPAGAEGADRGGRAFFGDGDQELHRPGLFAASASMAFVVLAAST